MAIHKTDDGSFVISTNHVWLPGVFESERTAKYAFRFPNRVLSQLQDSVNPGGVITFEMLQQARAALSKPLVRPGLTACPHCGHRHPPDGMCV